MPNETWEKCETKVQEMFNIKIGTEETIKIDLCHRIIPKKKNPTCPWTISCRLTKFKEKQKLLINAKILKDTRIIVYQDHCKDNMSVTTKLHKQDKFP